MSRVPAGRRLGHPVATAAVVVVVVLATLGALLAMATGGGDRPLDPGSHERLGTSALVALLERMGADVSVGDRPPDAGGDGPEVVLLLADLLRDDARRSLDRWVEGGGHLVVTDPGSAYAPEVVGRFPPPAEMGLPPSIADRCEIGALDHLDLAGIAPRDGGALFGLRPGDDACIGDRADRAYIVARDRGRGTVVAVGGSGMVVNAALAAGENAAVVTALLAPRAGTEVLVIEPHGPVGAGAGEPSLLDLVPVGARRALAQLAVAFVFYALWRARRLGRPVTEPQPVAVAGSELVAATGALLDRTRTPARAAELLRADLRRTMAERLGVPTGSPPDVLAATVAARTGIDATVLNRAIGDEPVTDDAALTDLARTIDRIREEVLTHA